MFSSRSVKVSLVLNATHRSSYPLCFTARSEPTLLHHRTQRVALRRRRGSSPTRSRHHRRGRGQGRGGGGIREIAACRGAASQGVWWGEGERLPAMRCFSSARGGVRRPHAGSSFGISRRLRRRGWWCWTRDVGLPPMAILTAVPCSTPNTAASSHASARNTAQTPSRCPLHHVLKATGGGSTPSFLAAISGARGLKLLRLIHGLSSPVKQSIHAFSPRRYKSNPALSCSVICLGNSGMVSTMANLSWISLGCDMAEN